MPDKVDLKAIEVAFSANAMNRWIIHKKDAIGQAWSGSDWVKVTLSPYGLPITTQVCNFKTEQEARDYWDMAKHGWRRRGER